MKKRSAEKIRFHYLDQAFSFSNREKLKGFLLKQLEREGRAVEAINYIFCSDEYLLKINRQYLNHNTYTDIITFELSPKSQPLVSDIYVSIDRVKDNAFRFHNSFKRELHRVIFHGALHLAGYKDKSAKDAKEMRQAEEVWLKKYFVPREMKR